jgi:LysM repeat protein
VNILTIKLRFDFIYKLSRQTKSREVSLRRWVIIIFFLISGLTIAGKALAVEYVVGEGDTLDSIAKKFNVPKEEIMRVNKLQDDIVVEGMILDIPTGYEKEPIIHEVKKGDTLFKISKKYGVPIEEIMKINNLTDKRLKVGQRLIIRPGKEVFASREIGLDISLLKNIANDMDLPEAEDFLTEEELNTLSLVGLREKIVKTAYKFLGVRYAFGANGNGAVDCSSLVKNIFAKYGISLPRTAREQFNVGFAVDIDELKPGDLLFFTTYAPEASHVGIYVGNGKFIHASTNFRRVTVANLNHPYFKKRFVGARRIIVE